MVVDRVRRSNQGAPLAVKLESGADKHNFWGSGLGGITALHLQRCAPAKPHSATRILRHESYRRGRGTPARAWLQAPPPASAASATAWYQDAQAHQLHAVQAPLKRPRDNYMLKPDTQIARTTSESQGHNRKAA